MKKYIPLLLILFLISTTYSQKVNLNFGKTKAKNYYTEIPFEFINDKIIVPVYINGNKYRFLLDTGSPNIISKEIYNIIKPKLVKTIVVTDSSNKKENLDLVSVEKLNFGNITFEKVGTLVYDLASNPIFKCFNINGFIGSNMLRNSIIQINANKKLIKLTDNRKNLSLQRKNSKRIQLLGNQSSPYLWVKLDGKDKGKEQVLIDTGMDRLYSVSLKNYNTFFKKVNIFNEIAESKGATSIGLFGKALTKNLKKSHFKLHLPLLKINRFKIEDYITNTSNSNDSKIGATLLNYGSITIDYKRKRFYFDAEKEKTIMEKSFFGFSKTLQNKKLVVGFVWDKELKDKINYGDEILEINKVKVDICSLLTQETQTSLNAIKVKIKPLKGDAFYVEVKKKVLAK